MIDRLKKKSITAHFKEVFTIFLFLENRKKLKKITQNYNVLIKELERLFINNPIDAPGSVLEIDEYKVLLKVAEIITSYHDYPIVNDRKEWSYFATKWNALNNFDGATQIEKFTTYHDIISAILRDWDRIKNSPYTYRCIASLIRMLNEEQG